MSLTVFARLRLAINLHLFCEAKDDPILFYSSLGVQGCVNPIKFRAGDCDFDHELVD
jgi:hypothetical protein